jgi:hypothetical protein
MLRDTKSGRYLTPSVIRTQNSSVEKERG